MKKVIDEAKKVMELQPKIQKVYYEIDIKNQKIKL